TRLDVARGRVHGSRPERPPTRHSVNRRPRGRTHREGPRASHRPRRNLAHPAAGRRARPAVAYGLHATSFVVTFAEEPIAPFPLPTHRTGRDHFGHPALGRVSPGGRAQGRIADRHWEPKPPVVRTRQ